MKIPRFKINIPKIRFPSRYVPQVKIPPGILTTPKKTKKALKTILDFALPYLKGLWNGTLYTITILTVIGGTIALTLTLVNPVNLVWSITPIQTPIYIVTYSSLMDYLGYFQEYYWYSVGIGAFAVIFGYSIHIRSLRSLYEGIKATPKAILYSPITLYKTLKNFRDWLFAKIEFLNGESEKWKRFFTVMKSPYTLLRSLGLNPQMAIAVLGIGSTTAVGVGVAEVIEIRSFAGGSAGIYSAPGEYPDEELEKQMLWRKNNPDDNTLRIVLGTTPVEEITISNVSVGTAYTGSALPSGKAEAILIEGKLGMSARLEIGELIF